MGYFENGVPRAVWGDIFLAAGLVVIGVELWKIFNSGVGAVFLDQVRDVVFFVVALVLFSLGSSMKSAPKQ